MCVHSFYMYIYTYLFTFKNVFIHIYIIYISYFFHIFIYVYLHIYMYLDVYLFPSKYVYMYVCTDSHGPHRFEEDINVAEFCEEKAQRRTPWWFPLATNEPVAEHTVEFEWEIISYLYEFILDIVVART